MRVARCLGAEHHVVSRYWRSNNESIHWGNNGVLLATFEQPLIRDRLMLGLRCLTSGEQLSTELNQD